MNTRKISYIDPDEDYLQKEVDWAIRTPFEERFKVFCNHIQTVYGFAGIDVMDYPIIKTIYYISDDENKLK
jgi:hypothetical protein